MKELIIGLIILIAISAIYWVYGTIKAVKDPDIQEASKLMMSIKHYRIYKEIYEEQTKCYDNNTPFIDRTNEIPNMNEWRRYCEYQVKKISEKWMSDLESLKK